jgi:hypothetical protein
VWLRKRNIIKYFTAISQPLYADSLYSCVNIALAWFHNCCSRRRRARDLFITGAMRVLLPLCRNSPFLLQQFLKPEAFFILYQFEKNGDGTGTSVRLRDNSNVAGDQFHRLQIGIELAGDAVEQAQRAANQQQVQRDTANAHAQVRAHL